MDLPNIKRDCLIKSLPKFVKLCKVRFSDYHGGWKNCDDIAECINLCRNLKELATLYFTFYSQESLMQSVHEQKNLEALKVRGMSKGVVTRNFLNYISSNLLELRVLDISFNYEVSDTDLKSICNLTKLEVLKMKELRNVTGSELVSFSNLKELNFRHCNNLEDDCLIKLLKCSPKLELLDIRGCEKITEAVLEVALEETKKRKNIIFLEMCVARTGINQNEINFYSPFLYLNFNL